MTDDDDAAIVEKSGETAESVKEVVASTTDTTLIKDVKSEDDEDAADDEREQQQQPITSSAAAKPSDDDDDDDGGTTDHPAAASDKQHNPRINNLPVFLKSMVIPIPTQIVDDDAPYVFPNLFLEVFDHMQASTFVYAMADLRKLAREGRVKNPEAILEEPIGFTDVVELISENSDELRKVYDENNINLYTDLLGNVELVMEELGRAKGYKDITEFEAKEETVKIVRYGDERAEEELVYAILVNSLDRIVCVTFRGTVTFTDVKKDLDVAVRWVPNPLSDIKGQSDEFGIHGGFGDYLYGKSKSDEEHKLDPKDFRKNTKFQRILDEVIVFLENNPGFRLYTTGHSLGGALASLFAFEAASSGHPSIPHPVSCVSVASPKVGNKQFRKAFSYLEQENKLRHIRLQNYMDPIPLVPNGGLCLSCTIFCFPNRMYRHVGVQLMLHRKIGLTIAYTKHRKPPYRYVHDSMKGFRIYLYYLIRLGFLCGRGAKYHGCQEHSERVKSNYEALKVLKLDEFYDRIRKGEHGVLHRQGK